MELAPSCSKSLNISYKLRVSIVDYFAQVF